MSDLQHGIVVVEMKMVIREGTGDSSSPTTVRYFPQAEQDQFRWSCDCKHNPLSSKACVHIKQAASILAVSEP